jgi:hypothetical protein
MVIQGKRSTRRKDDDMCRFYLLATVAGTLLADQDASLNVPNTNEAEENYARKRKAVKQKNVDEIMPLKNVAMENDGCSGFVVGSGSVNAFPRQSNVYLAENSSTRNEAESILDLLTLKSNKSCEHSQGLGIVTECGAFGVPHLGSTSSAEAEQVQEAEPDVMRSKEDEHSTSIYSLFNSVDLDGRPTALVSSDSSSVVPLCSRVKEPKTSSLCQNEVQHTAKIDDDDNSSGCTHPSPTENNGYKPHYLSDHRIRKLFASKARKAARSKMCGGVSHKGIPIPLIWYLSSIHLYMLHSCNWYLTSAPVHHYFSEQCNTLTDKGLLIALLK